MEDPKRMRTKLRLDLADVRRQIEDLEDVLKKDKSPENVEAHAKLVEYEKKLKEQYESMTGLSIERASKLEEKVIIAQRKKEKSPFAAFLGLLAGLLIAWGYYNTVLHSIVGFGPLDLVNYFTGTGGSVAGLNTFMTSLLYESSTYLVIFPLVGGIFLLLIADLLDKSRGNLSGFLEVVSFVLVAGLFVYVLYSSDNVEDASNLFTDLMFYYAIAVLLAGLLLFISGLGQSSGLNKVLSISSGILVVYSGIQFYLLTDSESSIATEVVWQYPWITVPIVVASFFIALTHFIKLFAKSN